MVIEPPASAPAPAPTPSATEDDVVIAARGLGKMYRIYDKPQDRLKQMLLWRLGRHYGREFWALRDVSFEVRRGESVGIIGRNGSGKSTLLQIIAGTLAPSEGEVTVRGRVAALLELGSGFNPEFTGRENVFMNGAILGLSREEIEARYDDIAAFADIGEFIEQPVKLYSSGMVVRLAFAVQAHVQPDLLIVDEALSVGDVFFQHKCMHHIRGLIDRGTTLLFVSHSTDSVKRLCTHGLWLDGGRARHYGAAGVAAEKYLAFMRMQVQDAGGGLPDDDEAPALQPRGGATAGDDGAPLRFEADPSPAWEQTAVERYGAGRARITAVRLLDHESGAPVSELAYGQRVRLQIHAERSEPVGPRLDCSYIVRDRNRVDLFGTTTYDEGVTIDPRAQRAVVEFSFQVRLGPGSYSVLAAVVECSNDMSYQLPLDCIEIACVFTVGFDRSRPVWYTFFEPVVVRTMEE